MAGEKVSIVTNWEVERVGSRAEVILYGRAQCKQASEDMVLLLINVLKREESARATISLKEGASSD